MCKQEQKNTHYECLMYPTDLYYGVNDLLSGLVYVMSEYLKIIIWYKPLV